MIDNYDKMTLEMYKKVKDIINNSEDDYQTKVELVAVLNDMDVDDVLDLPLTTFNRLLQSIGFLFEVPKPRIPLTKYKLGGYELETMLDIHNMTAGQFIDYQTFVKNVDNNLAELLSIFLIPKGHKYGDGYDMVEIQNVIKTNLTIRDALGLADFFLQWYKSLLTATISCLSKKITKMKKRETKMEMVEKYEQALTLLKTSGDGLQWLTELQKQ